MGRKWQQQGIFAERVKEFCRANNLLTPRGAVRLDLVSDMFNLEPETLRQFLQNKSRNRPHYDTLAFIARVIGCNPQEFLDSLVSPPCLPNEKWAEMSERGRVLASAMVADIAADEFSAGEKEELFRAYAEARDRIRRLRELWLVSPERKTSTRKA
jgi:transcriptional regulator with XRE-family HTH domain